MEPLTIVTALAALTTICTGMSKAVGALRQHWTPRAQAIPWFGNINARLFNWVVASALLLVGVAFLGAFLVLARNDAEELPATAFANRVAFKVRGARSTSQAISGDCITQDQVWRGHSDGEVIGDLSGRVAIDWEGALDRAQACQEGDIRGDWTITNSSGEKLFGHARGTGRIRGLGDPGSASTGSTNAVVIKGGTGSLEGVTGSGHCSEVVSRNDTIADGTVVSTSDSDCVFTLMPRGRGGDSLLMAVGASPSEITVFGGSSTLSNRTTLSVIFTNASGSDQKGLQLRLPQPRQASILAAVRGEIPGVTGDRIWPLPDLRKDEDHSLQITVSLLTAEVAVVPLTLEVTRGGRRTVESDPVLVRVLR